MDVAQVRARHEQRLLTLPNVVGVMTGRDERTGDAVLQVLVTHKVPLDRLGADEAVPAWLDGVAVQVVDAGGEVVADRP
jgi:hypothetical protein